MNETGQEASQLYQAVRCGALRVAFPYGWASTIVERYTVTPVPKAPSWLVGAANIDGLIFPVIDLAHYTAGSSVGARRSAHTATFDNTNSNRRRLLIGGVGVVNNENRLAIEFDGLPQQIGREVAKYQAHAHVNANPASLTDGTVEAKSGERFALVNVERLIARLASELSTV
jgi:chemotaxis signal transduction protein